MHITVNTTLNGNKMLPPLRCASNEYPYHHMFCYFFCLFVVCFSFVLFFFFFFFFFFFLFVFFCCCCCFLFVFFFCFFFFFVLFCFVLFVEKSGNYQYFCTTYIDKFSRRQNDGFFLFSQKIGFDISSKLSPKDSICMKCERIYFGQNKKNISNFRLLNILPSMLSVK